MNAYELADEMDDACIEFAGDVWTPIFESVANMLRQQAQRIEGLEKQIVMIEKNTDYWADKNSWIKQSEPAYWVLKTGHGTKIVEVKPYCEVDLWKPLYYHPPSTPQTKDKE